MKAVLMAGGRGTRIRSIASDIPKPMIPVSGKPVLEYVTECLRDQGFTDIIITVGHMAQYIMDYFGNGDKNSPVTGQPFGVKIQYYVERQPLGNAGAVYKLWESGKLDGDFLLLIADALFHIDFNRFVRFHKYHNALATIFVHPNSHPYDSGLVSIDEKTHVITDWLHKEDKRPEFYKNRVNAGLHIISPDIFKQLPKSSVAGSERAIDLDRDILKPLAGSGSMYAYNSPEYCRDMGTPERYNAVLQDIESRLVKMRNLCNRQKAIFFELDSIMYEKCSYQQITDTYELYPGAGELIRLINKSVFLCIVIVSPAIAVKWNINLEQLDHICSKMETLLGREGVYIDVLYDHFKYCDERLDKDLAGLKNCADDIKQGLLNRVFREYNISLEDSWIIKNSDYKFESGMAVPCNKILLSCKNEETVDRSVWMIQDLFSEVKKIVTDL